MSAEGGSSGSAHPSGPIHLAPKELESVPERTPVQLHFPEEAGITLRWNDLVPEVLMLAGNVCCALRVILGNSTEMAPLVEVDLFGC